MNGQVVDETLIQMVEQLGSSNMEEMQKNFAAVDTCSGIGKTMILQLKECTLLFVTPVGMDECDTAAIMYQCGQEKAPNLVANAISAVELNKSAASDRNQINFILIKTRIVALGFSAAATEKTTLSIKL